jgi:hypothetical protein
VSKQEVEVSNPVANKAVWLVALALTAVNAVKPITVDDTIFYFYARELLAAPLDPYGFNIFWEVQPVSALDLFAPVGMPYWWSLGLRVLGDEPWMWKLWMFPYALLLTHAISQLLNRFARDNQTSLLLLTVLGPTILPAFNLMIDIPSLALGVGAMVLFMRACDQERQQLAVAAGVVAALALETKFTAFAPVAAMLGYGLLARQWRLLFTTSGVTLALFVGAELTLYQAYGTSHFLRSLEIPEQAIRHNTTAGWAIGWIALSGALAAPVALLGLASLQVKLRTLAFAAALTASPFVAIAFGTRPANSIPFGPTQLGAGDTELLIFFAAGLCVVAVVGVAIASRLRASLPQLTRAHQFLLLWFGIELLACFAISPFHALRRLIGPALAGTLLVAHGISPGHASAKRVNIVAAVGLSLGLLFSIADTMDARARYQVQDQIASELTRLGHDPKNETVWFTGHWGFQFYAERRGYKPIIAGHSVVQQGDWLLVPNRSSGQPVPSIALSRSHAVIVATSAFPLSTTPSAYMAAVPMRRQPEAQNRIAIRRIVSSGDVPVYSRRGRH